MGFKPKNEANKKAAKDKPDDNGTSGAKEAQDYAGQDSCTSRNQPSDVCTI